MRHGELFQSVHLHGRMDQTTTEERRQQNIDRQVRTLVERFQQEGGPDIFVHVSALSSSGLQTLSEGQRVQFTITQGKKGPQAENVAPL